MSEDLSMTNADRENPSQFNAMMWLPPTMIVTRTIVIANVVVFGVMVARGMSFLNPDGLTLLNWGANWGP